MNNTTAGNAGRVAGYQYARNIGRGILENVRVTVVQTGDGQMRAVVSGRAQELAPVLVPRVSQTVEGPVEEFREDG